MCVITAVKLVHYLCPRRQSQGPSLQHRALLETLVLTENGARLELLDPDTKVGIIRIVNDRHICKCAFNDAF